ANPTAIPSNGHREVRRVRSEEAGAEVNAADDRATRGPVAVATGPRAGEKIAGSRVENRYARPYLECRNRDVSPLPG
ncbi:hypothetical protein, partial [Frankia sp. CpI1-P]|uniref:hypothetical protein n=1 Tax=Frankia sp. CpI1-P TaxID=1502734 RepID=UPI001A7EB6AC